MPKVKGKSITRNHFEKINNDTAKCKLCEKIIKVGGGTSNMLAHLKRSHPQATLDVQGPVVGDQTGNLAALGQSEQEQSSSTSKTPRLQTTLKGILVSNKKEIDKYLTMMIATDFQPYSIVEDRGFKRFVEVLNSNYKLPSRQKIRYELMPQLYENAKLKLATVLENVKHAALTADLWSNQNMDSFITVTVHFFLKGDLKSYVLTTSDVPTEHTAIHLAEIITDLLTEWKLTDKITAIVTDNAPNMIRMCELLGIRHMPCFAHTLNLTVNDSLDLPEVMQIINKCKVIVKFFKKSSVGWRALKAEQKERNPNTTPLKLVQEVSTRWNSIFYMMSRILQLSDILALVCRKLIQAPDYLTASEEIVGNEIIRILEIFEQATKLVSADSYPTSSLIIPVICGLYENLTTIENTLVTDIGKMFCSSIRRNMSNRLLIYETRTVTQMATYLNPILRTGFRRSENMLSAKELVRKELSHLLKDSDTNITATTSERAAAQTSAETILEHKKPGLLDFLKHRKPTTTNPTASAVNLVRMYLETVPHQDEAEPAKATESACTFWRDNQHLTPLNIIALKYLSVPATSVPAERIFSKSGYILTSRRSRLQADGVDQLCFVNQNYDLCD